MGKKIVVAGGGHGGIAAAAILAQHGFDVTVYEKNRREDMGYDWTDIFDRKGLLTCGIEMPPEDKYRLKNDMTFFSPSREKPIKQHVPEEQLEIQMDRKDIYDHIISHAENCGVKFVYETEVEAPVMLGGRVAGIRTADETVYADLVIDAAGLNSPIRTQLPDALGIQKEPDKYDVFYVYRAFYNKTAPVEEDKYRVYLMFDDKPQVCWVADDEEYTDVLIGRFEPLTEEEVEETLGKLREINDDLGTELVRGGQFVTIPVRQPLGILVADGYAAIGDSAFMTVPIIGSGIANSLKAAKLLADAVIEDEEELYTAETLWKYQREFYKKLGNGLAPLAIIKLMIDRFSPRDIDYFFDNNILNSEDMTFGADTNSIMCFIEKLLNLDSLKSKVKGFINDFALSKKVFGMNTRIAAVMAITKAMPVRYDRKRIKNWSEGYIKCFKID